VIRRADSKDIMPIIEMGKALIARLGSLPELHEQDSKMLLARALCDRKQLLLVSERDRSIKGFFWGGVEQYVFSREKLAQDIIFHATDGSMPFMIHRFIRWAKEQGVKPQHIALGVSNASDPLQMDSLMDKIKFQRTGGYYRYRGK
jgi:hypothetical protein